MLTLNDKKLPLNLIIGRIGLYDQNGIDSSFISV